MLSTMEEEKATATDILASLFGSHQDRDEFFRKDFGKNVVHVRRETSANTILDLNLPCIDMDGRMDMKVLFDSTNYVALRKRGSLNYLDKNQTNYAEFCGYIRDGGSAVIPVAEENALMPFRAAIEESINHNPLRRQQQQQLDNSDEIIPDCTIGINVYHSGPSAVALNRHFDQYDVIVLHLDGQKDWEIGFFEDDHVVDTTDAGALQQVQTWKNQTLAPGDLLYIPKGIYHAATTAEGYESTTHATIGIEY